MKKPPKDPNEPEQPELNLGMPKVNGVSKVKRGMALKEEGMALVLEHNAKWNAHACAFFSEFVVMQTKAFTIDDFKDYTRGVLPPPGHCNAWGALWSSMAKKRLMMGTGVYVKSRTVACHAAMNQLWKAPEVFLDAAA